MIDTGGGNGSVSSMGAAVDGPSSQIASTRAKLYIDEALSNDEPSCVNVWELWVATTRNGGKIRMRFEMEQDRIQ